MFFGAIKTFLQRDIFQTRIKKKLLFQTMFYVIFEVFVTVLHLEYPQMGLNLLPERAFDSKMSKTKFTKLAK